MNYPKEVQVAFVHFASVLKRLGFNAVVLLALRWCSQAKLLSHFSGVSFKPAQMGSP